MEVGGILVIFILGFGAAETAVGIGVEEGDELPASAVGFSFFGGADPPSFARRCARIWG